MSQTQSLSKRVAQTAASKQEGKQPSPKQTTPAELAELAHGQIVIVTARWILVVSALFLTLWNPDALRDLRLQILVIMLLAMMNFYLHAQLLMERKTFEYVVYLASLLDFVVITLLIWTQSGFDSNIYIFYFPAVLAISVAFETLLTIGFMSSIIAIYTLISLSSMSSAGNLQILFSRILMLTAVAFCGNLYWRIEHNRRQAAQKARAALLAEVRQRHNERTNTLEQEKDNANAK